MYVVELEFGAEPERLAARPAHRDRLQRLRDNGQVVLAGPWADDSGALLVFDVPSRDALDRLLDDDPYFGTPGVSVVRRVEWTPIVG